MGRRRIRLLKKIDSGIYIAGVDSKFERRQNAETALNIKTYAELEMALNEIKPECVVVATSPSSHGGIIEICLEHGSNVFTELNLVSDKYETNIALARRMNKVLFLSSTFLYRSEIRHIKDRIIQYLGRLNYIYHAGQYLPDWHPWEDIQDYFVGNKRTNGCRELFAIELPWIIKLFGDIESYEVISSKNTTLPINYNDNYLLLIKHKNGNKGVLGIDVVSRKAVRNLEIYGENLYISWDGSPSGLKEYDFINKVYKEISLYDSIDKQEGYASFIIENAYQSELETFINIVNGVGTAEYTFEEDAKVLAMIERIEGIDQ